MSTTGPNEPQMPAWLRWGVLTGMLLTGVAFLVVSAASEDVFHVTIDLFKEGWTFVTVSLFVMFGIKVGDLIQVRRNGGEQ